MWKLWTSPKHVEVAATKAQWKHVDSQFIGVTQGFPLSCLANSRFITYCRYCQTIPWFASEQHVTAS